MDNTELNDKDQKNSTESKPSQRGQGPGVDREALKALIKKKLRPVHRQVIAPPGQ